MKNPFILCLILLLTGWSFIGWSQGVAINTSSSPPDGSAMLDVSSTLGGVLIPRMTEAQRDAITTPATGLMVFQIDEKSGYYFYNGTSWAIVGSGAFAVDDLWDGRFTGNSLFLGLQAGDSDDGSDNENVGLGPASLKTNVLGSYNTAVGFGACYGVQSDFNTGVGYETLFGLAGDGNTAIGYAALRHNTNVYNTAVGYMALDSNTSGGYNTASGANALIRNTGGSFNCAVGEAALFNNIDGEANTAIGRNSSKVNTSGSYNTSLGNEANYWNTTGSNNTIIGYQAGRGNSTHAKSGNVFLGHKAGYHETGSNKLYIENSEAMLPLIYGDFNNDIVRINGTFDITGNLGIDVTNPIGKMHIQGGSNTLPAIYLEDGTADIAFLHGQKLQIGHWDETSTFTLRLMVDVNGYVGIGTDTPTSPLQVPGVPEYADNAAAIAGGLTAGAFYRTGDVLKVVH